jgi:hypothetical protein
LRQEQTSLAKPGKTRGLKGTGTGVARQAAPGRIVGRLWSQTKPYCQFKPGPLAGYPDLLPTLSTPARSQPPNVSLNLQDFGLHVHLQTSMITACKCISTLVQSWPRIPSANMHDHGLQVYLQSRSITSSECISNTAQLRPPSLLDYGLRLHLQVHTMTV